MKLLKSVSFKNIYSMALSATYWLVCFLAVGTPFLECVSSSHPLLLVNSRESKAIISVLRALGDRGDVEP